MGRTVVVKETAPRALARIRADDREVFASGPIRFRAVVRERARAVIRGRMLPSECRAGNRQRTLWHNGQGSTRESRKGS
jgi:hypothetical protein